MKTVLCLIIFSFSLILQLKAQNFQRGQTIQEGEYFYNTDPGEGKGMSILSQYGAPNAQISFNTYIDKTTIIYVRFKSSNGKWSAPASINSYDFKNSGGYLAGGEYFNNSDPGTGNGMPFSISGSEINIPSVQLIRNNILYIRVKDSFGRWSPPYGVKYLFEDLRYAEYQIRYANGTLSQYYPMSIKNIPVNSPFFTASSQYSNPLTMYDTIFVRFQRSDYFLSGEAKIPAIVSIKEDNSLPKEFKLYNAYPNPFNPSTTIEYDIPVTCPVTLQIYDILGRLVSTLVNENKRAGHYSVIFNADSFTSGTYLCLIRADYYKEVRKINLIK